MSDQLKLVLKKLQSLSDSQVKEVADFIYHLKNCEDTGEEKLDMEEEESFLNPPWKKDRFDL